MKILEKRLVDTEVDRICDVCEKSLKIKINGDEFEEQGSLKADFGFGSRQDGNSYHLDLCERCFMIALYALRDERKSHVMFDDNAELSDENFGLDLSRCSRNQ